MRGIGVCACIYTPALAAALVAQACLLQPLLHGKIFTPPCTTCLLDVPAGDVKELMARQKELLLQQQAGV
jgi:hypothetical protein